MTTTQHDLVIVFRNCSVTRPAAVTPEGDVRIDPATDNIQLFGISGQDMFCLTCRENADPGTHGLAEGGYDDAESQGLYVYCLRTLVGVLERW